MPGDEQRPQDAVEAANELLDETESSDDLARLKVLDDLYASLESELDRENDQAGPPRR